MRKINISFILEYILRMSSLTTAIVLLVLVVLMASADPVKKGENSFKINVYLIHTSDKL